jgi:hypothetical protein
MPCFDIVVPHYLKVVLFEVLCREASFTSMKPRIGFGADLAVADWREIVVQAFRLERFKCNNISKYGTRQQY